MFDARVFLMKRRSQQRRFCRKMDPQGPFTRVIGGATINLVCVPDTFSSAATTKFSSRVLYAARGRDEREFGDKIYFHSASGGSLAIVVVRRTVQPLHLVIASWRRITVVPAAADERYSRRYMRVSCSLKLLPA